MGLRSHSQVSLEQRKPEVRAAILTRNYKHIAAEFPAHATPDELESDNNDPTLTWRLMSCPYRSPCEECGRYSCHLDHFVVAIDGACSHNGTAQARAAIAVYFGPDNNYNFAGLLDNDPHPTSQRAELSAAIKALEIFRSIRDIEPYLNKLDTISFTIKSDSAYLVSSMTDYIFKWRQNGFRTANRQPVKNQDLFTHLENLVTELTNDEQNVFFWHVPREYNVQADEMAKEALKARVPAGFKSRAKDLFLTLGSVRGYQYIPYESL